MGRLVYDLGNRQWDIPALRKALEKILPEQGVLKNFEVEHDFESIGQRVLVLNAKRLDHLQCILVSVDDLTKQRCAERELMTLNETLENHVAERTAEIQKRIGQLQRISLDLVDTEHRERRRLAVILHDDLQQILVAAQMHARTAHDRDPELEKAEVLEKLLNQAIEATRVLSKELAPPVLSEKGLGAALHCLARWAQERYDLKLEVQVSENAEPSNQQVRVFLYGAIRELLTNVVKHAGSDRVVVSLQRDEDVLRLRVEDFGHGFDLAAVKKSKDGKSFGLFSLKERLELMDGHVEIDSSPGRGTRVELTVPLDFSPLETDLLL